MAGKTAADIAGRERQWLSVVDIAAGKERQLLSEGRTVAGKPVVAGRQVAVGTKTVVGKQIVADTGCRTDCSSSCPLPSEKFQQARSVQQERQSDGQCCLKRRFGLPGS